jgi:DNA polymerase I-like protein with 3'-5' exonuclease and polymerase domains
MLIWPDDSTKGKRTIFNPRPKVPKTGWVLKNDFPSLKGAKAISFDVETKDPEIKEQGAGWARGSGHIIGIAIGTDDGFARYFPMRHEDCGDCNLNPDDVIAYCNVELGRDSQPKVAHNAIYDFGWCSHEGIQIKGDLYCTWTAEKLLSHSSGASLEEAGQRYLGEGKVSDVLYQWAWNYWGKGQTHTEAAARALAMQNLWRTPPSLAGAYAESDVRLPLQIAPYQFDLLEEKGMWDLYRMECDLIKLLVEMRMAGVSVDLDKANHAYDLFGETIKELQAEVNHIAGKTINTGSAKEIAPVFDKLKIAYPRTEKTGAPSFKGEFLKSVEHPLAAKIVELEELKKYQSTFVKGQILEANVNGKVYCSFNPLRAVTGRMSCSTPNLQQTPSRNKLAKVVRSIFIPDKGHLCWEDTDFSSIESRLLASYAVGQGAKELRKEYNDNPDTNYHKFTHAMIKNLVGLDLQHKHVKSCNFAGIYGASQKKLQTMMGITDAEAEVFFTAYHDGLPYIKSTMAHMSNLVETQGYTTTILGRRSVFDRWEPKFSQKGLPRPVALPFNQAVKVYGPNIKRAHLHKALNHLLQGSAAELMKMSMVKCYRDGVFDVIGVPRLVVHDALEFSVRDDSLSTREGFREMRHTMITAIKFKVPLRVETHRGSSWGECDNLVVD